MDLAINSGEQVVDYIEHACAADVEFGDFFGTGEMPFHYEGSILHRAKWEI